MIETERLQIFPLSLDELTVYLQAGGKLELLYGLPDTGRVVAQDVRVMVEEFTIPKIRTAGEQNYLFITFWIVVEKETGWIVAELGFKGEPNESGYIEIGYGTMPSHRKKGFMTEAVAAMVEWAKKQPGIRGVLAETESENIASIRVVQKNHFRQYGKKGARLMWKIAFP